MNLHTLLTDLHGIFFPTVCAGCSDTLLHNEHILCTQCLLQLPKTHFHNDNENPVAQTFWGRCSIQNATAYLYFTKKGIVQSILHRLKYKGEKEIGIFMGKMLAYELHQTAFTNVDLIVPVPLHEHRFNERGYNQSEYIAKGIAEVLRVPVVTDILKRTVASSTQTRKHRYERWLNVNEIFENCNPQKLENKHVLLVDDVITTGATLEACAQVLLESANVKVSIVALARA